MGRSISLATLPLHASNSLASSTKDYHTPPASSAINAGPVEPRGGRCPPSAQGASAVVTSSRAEEERNPSSPEHLIGLVDMSLDFGIGNKLAKENAIAHLEAAELLLHDGHTGFSINHALLALEEAAKAVFCELVRSGTLNDSDFGKVFRQHPPKAILYDQVFESDVHIYPGEEGYRVDIDGEAFLASMRKALSGGRKSAFATHNRTRNRGVYVDLDGEHWVSPSHVSSQVAKDIVAAHWGKAVALVAISEMLSNLGAQKFTLVGSFRVEDVDYDKRNITLVYDDI